MSIGGGGALSGGAVTKKLLIKPLNGLSASAAPGISISNPSLRNRTLCTPPQSEVTKPLNPISPFKIVFNVSLLPHANGPLMRLYEHITDDTPAFTASANGAAYTSWSVCWSTNTLNESVSYAT